MNKLGVLLIVFLCVSCYQVERNCLPLMLLVTSFMFLGNNLEEYYKAR